MREMLDIDRNHPSVSSCMASARRDGKVQVAQIWEFEEYAQSFDEKLLAPVLRAVGASLDANVTVYELEDLVTP